MFDLVDFKIEIAASALNIPEFKAIWKRDKKRAKTDAYAELCYVFFMCDYKSEYRNYPEKEREQKIIEDFCAAKLTDKWKPDAKVKAAMARYTEMQETPSLRYLKSQEDMIEKITSYMNRVESEDFDDDDKLLTIVVNNSEKCNKIVAALPKLKESIQKEVAETSSIRGGGEKGYMED
jgi:hypothetical protein